MEDCPICCETFNKSTRKEISCPFSGCNFSSCKACTRKYLLGTQKAPHCMGCNKGWEQRFLVKSLNKSFVITEYKNHRKELLVGHEISRLQDTMPAVERHKEAKKRLGYIKELKLKKEALRKELWEIKHLIGTAETSYWDLLNGPKTEYKKKFIMACQVEDCRGFLSTGYKCGICELFTCSKCLEVLGPHKDIEHTCDPANIETAELIRKQTKPCPSCATRISKVDGCNQMWCTNCRTAFDWNKGTILTGTIHNPHFFEYQRSVTNGDIPRQPGDNPCGQEGEIPSYRQLDRFIRSLNHSCLVVERSSTDIVALNGLIRHIFRVLGHLGWDRDSLRRVRQNNDNNEALRVEYILKTITREDLKKKIYNKDLIRRRSTEVINIYDVFITCGSDLLKKMFSWTPGHHKFTMESITENIQELQRLRTYCNKQLAIVAAAYNRQTLFVSPTFRIKTQKPLMKKLLEE